MPEQIDERGPGERVGPLREHLACDLHEIDLGGRERLADQRVPRGQRAQRGRAEEQGGGGIAEEILDSWVLLRDGRIAAQGQDARSLRDRYRQSVTSGPAPAIADSRS